MNRASTDTYRMTVTAGEQGISPQTEGTLSLLSDLLFFEMEGVQPL
jgi:hypothetical protein